MLEDQKNEDKTVLKDIIQKLNILMENQKQYELKVQELTDKINAIYSDIYDINEEDFEVNCPYCNYVFYSDIDENVNEIKCPECGNKIELDWNGNPDNGQDFNCNGSCSHCKGCEN